MAGGMGKGSERERGQTVVWFGPFLVQALQPLCVVPRMQAAGVWGCQLASFPTGNGYALPCQNPPSRSCCSARCACPMSRAVFLSAQPCFHGLQRPQADALRALILRWVSLVFTGVLNDAVCGAALFLDHAAFVARPQVPPLIRSGHQGVFALVRHGSLGFDLQVLGGGEFALVHVKGQEFPRAQVQRRGDVEDVKAPVPIGSSLSTALKVVGQAIVCPLRRARPATTRCGAETVSGRRFGPPAGPHLRGDAKSNVPAARRRLPCRRPAPAQQS